MKDLFKLAIALIGTMVMSIVLFPYWIMRITWPWSGWFLAFALFTLWMQGGS